MISFSNLVKRAQFLKTVAKKVEKPFKAFTELPRVVKLGLAALILIGLVIYLGVTADGWVEAMILIGIVALVCAGLWLVSRVVQANQKRRADDFDAQFGETEMLEDLRGQWNRAVDELGTAGVDRYNMAFYMLIGEPQSGKTTTLQKSGLNFPIGMDKIQGIGGTRNLDWWFTDEAVILDTAGRLTFQDEGQSDEEEWAEFLGLLRRYRPKCPINGVIVTIPATSLLEDDSEERERKAQIIRSALVEIERNLEVQYPVYVLVTKADRVGGFAEFFGKLRAIEQTQLLGWSRPSERFGQSFSGDEAREAFQDLVAQMRRWRIYLMDQLADEQTAEERDRMYAFPEELALLEQPLAQYLESIFPESRLLDPLYMRGFYITSGLQSGVPVLEACAKILGGTAIGKELIERQRITAEKAYFIRDFYRKKVFRERGLIVPTKQRVRRVLMVKKVGYAAASILAVLGTGWVGYRFLETRRSVNEPVEKFADLREAHAQYANRPFQGYRDNELDDPIDAVLKSIVALGDHSDRMEEEGSGIIPEILSGRRLSARGFLKVAGSDQAKLHKGIREALRGAFAEDVLRGLASRGLTRLEELGEGSGASRSTLSKSLEIRRDALGDVVAMLVEEDRARAVAAGGADVPLPPAELDGLFRLTLGKTAAAAPDAARLERARDAYDLVREVTNDPSFYDADFVNESGTFAGVGLSHPWCEVGRLQETDEDIGRAFKDLRDDFIGALTPDGTHDQWVDAEARIGFDMAGIDLTDPATVKLQLEDGSELAPRRRGYVAMRCVALEQNIRTALEEIKERQQQFLGLRHAEVGAPGPLPTVEAAIESLRADAIRQLDVLDAHVAELDYLLRCADQVAIDLDESLGAIAKPMNDFHESIHQTLAPYADVPGEQSGNVMSKWRSLELLTKVEGPWIDVTATPSYKSASRSLSETNADCDVVQFVPSDATGKHWLREAKDLGEVRRWSTKLRSVVVPDGRWSTASDALYARFDDAAAGRALAAFDAEESGLTSAAKRSVEAPAPASEQGDAGTATGTLVTQLTSESQKTLHVIATTELRRRLVTIVPDLQSKLARPFAPQGQEALPLAEIRARRLDRHLMAINDVVDDVSRASRAARGLGDDPISPQLAEAKELLTAIDGSAKDLVERWDRAWREGRRNEFEVLAQDLVPRTGLSWFSRREAARGIVGRQLAATGWTRHWQEQRAENLAALDIGPEAKPLLSAFSGETPDALPETTAVVRSISDALDKIADLTKDGETSDFMEALAGIAKLLDDTSLDFGSEVSGDLWKNKAADETWISNLREPLAAFRAQREAFDNVEPNRVAPENYLHVAWFLGQVAYRLEEGIRASVLADMQSDYQRLQTISSNLGFPFAVKGTLETVPTQVDLDRFIGTGGELSRYAGAYGAVGLFVYVPPAGTRDLNGEPVSAALNAAGGLGLDWEIRADMADSVSRWLDAQDLYLGRVDGVENDSRKLTWKRIKGIGSNARDAESAAPYLSIATRLGSLGQAHDPSQGADVVHLENRVERPQTLVWDHNTNELYVQVSSKTKGNPADEIFEFGASPRFHGDRSSARTTSDNEVRLKRLDYRSSFPLLEFLGDVRASSIGALSFQYTSGDPGSTATSRSTQITIPIKVHVDPSKAGSPKSAFEAVLTVQVMVEGVFVPEPPLQSRPW